MAHLLFVQGRTFAVFDSLYKNLGTLTLLLILFPFNFTVVIAALLWSGLTFPFRKKVPPAANPKTILITGGKMTKALQLARSFHGVGHRVILVEAHKYWLVGHRFSQAVDRFYTVPAPQKDPEGYIQGLLAIAKQENVDIYVPVCSPVASYYDSLAKPALSGCCEVFHFDAEVTKMLDDKFAFTETARSFGLSVPKSFKITAPEQVLNFDFSNETRKYILKSIPYDSVRRLNLTKLPCDTPEETAAFVNSLPISEEKPWIMQEFIPGKEYCTHSTIRNGELRLHCCCESSAFQVNYENVEQPDILQWVSQFVQELKLTGQASFDFIEAEDGTIYAIECNPRTHSAITMFYSHPGVADAYLGQKPLGEPLQPLPDSKPTYWLYHELWRLNEIRSFKDLQRWFKTVFGGKDAIFEVNDPLPFLMVHHWQIPLLLLDNLRRMQGWVKIDFNIGKLVELGGD
ncbi:MULTISPECIES: ATP-grasp domain-containing protein [unclassified Coleofasciculus]|uniref:ATP-grasp domain-containing protein n=1 Tax=unclassified Coleofasciculus TaxID=2692782 RepID=UPI00188087AF|nr:MULTISPECIES: ATP-grasp domain-containing protein [unclassified Coleofasciculus]MBE9128406.1 ATP-grasp domain-containing protein [Coleofasciculus sp. LEGE 07081]MBE9150360.1 ATP-grasp domain-containing protein [Coleofasciculus sp. LEGE 07092]